MEQNMTLSPRRITRAQAMMFVISVQHTVAQKKHSKPGRGTRIHSTKMQYLMHLFTD